MNSIVVPLLKRGGWVGFSRYKQVYNSKLCLFSFTTESSIFEKVMRGIGNSILDTFLKNGGTAGMIFGTPYIGRRERLII